MCPKYTGSYCTSLFIAAEPRNGVGDSQDLLKRLQHVLGGLWPQRAARRQHCAGPPAEVRCPEDGVVEGGVAGKGLVTSLRPRGRLGRHTGS